MFWLDGLEVIGDKNGYGDEYFSNYGLLFLQCFYCGLG